MDQKGFSGLAKALPGRPTSSDQRPCSLIYASHRQRRTAPSYVITVTSSRWRHDCCMCSSCCSRSSGRRRFVVGCRCRDLMAVRKFVGQGHQACSHRRHTLWHVDGRWRMRRSASSVCFHRCKKRSRKKFPKKSKYMYRTFTDVE